MPPAPLTPLREMTKPGTAQELVRDNLTIPTLPEIILRINKLVDDPNMGCREIGELVGEDPPLAAKVLKIANSAFYGLSGECVSTEHASTVLGVRVLRNVVTQAAVVSQFEHLEQGSFNLQELWLHAIHTGHVAAFLAKKSTVPTELAPDEFYVCGLLHDVGKVVMLEGLGPAYANAVQQAQGVGEPHSQAEQREYGFDHTAVGSIVATRWGLPDGIVGAIGGHHGNDDALSESPEVAIVAVADRISHHLRDFDEEPETVPVSANLLASMGIPVSSLEEVLEHARNTKNVQL